VRASITRKLLRYLHTYYNAPALLVEAVTLVRPPAPRNVTATDDAYSSGPRRHTSNASCFYAAIWH
jgi:hypothetical protein